MSNIADDIGQLTVRERLELISKLWESIADEEFEDELTPAQKAELDEAIAEYEQNPEEGLTLEELMASLRARR